MKISYFKNKKYSNNQDVKQPHTSVLLLADSLPRRFPKPVTPGFSARQVTVASSGQQDIPYATKHAIPSNHTTALRHLGKGLGSGTERKLILRTRNSRTLEKRVNRENEASVGLHSSWSMTLLLPMQFEGEPLPTKGRAPIPSWPSCLLRNLFF